MSKVFVVNYGGHDLSDAYRFTGRGDKDLIYITSGNVNVFNTDRITQQMIHKMREFNEDDFLLLCGYGILSAICLSHLLSRFDSVKVLLFNAKAQEYIVRHIKQKEVFNDEASSNQEGQ